MLGGGGGGEIFGFICKEGGEFQGSCIGGIAGLMYRRVGMWMRSWCPSVEGWGG